MRTGTHSAKAAPDRLSTMDEVQAALCFLPEIYIPCVTDSPTEARSDQGDRVFIDPENENAAFLTLLEKVDLTPN